MIPKEEFFKRLVEKYPDKESLDNLASAGQRVMLSAEELKGKTITLSLPADMTLDNIVNYVAEKEKELADGACGILSPYGFYQKVKNYISWQKSIENELVNREFFYDLINERGYDLANKKIAVLDTVCTRKSPNLAALKEVLTVCDGNLVDSFVGADAAIYFGKRFCDPEAEYEGSWPTLSKIIYRLQKDENITALIFYNKQESEVCEDEEDRKLLFDLARQRKNIFIIPKDRYYKGKLFTN